MATYSTNAKLLRKANDHPARISTMYGSAGPIHFVATRVKVRFVATRVKVRMSYDRNKPQHAKYAKYLHQMSILLIVVKGRLKPGHLLAYNRWRPRVPP